MMKHSSRLRIIKIVFAVIVILLLFVPASVSHPQIDMRALVAALGIDISANPDELEVSVEIILPVESGGSAGSSEVISGGGKTLSEALDSIGISLGRRLELNHCGIIVLGLDYAKKGVTDELEYLLSSSMVCPEINLTVSANETANEFLQELSVYSQKLDLSNLLRYTDLGVQNYSRSLVRFLRDCRSSSACSALPCFKMGDRAENSRDSDTAAEVEKSLKQNLKLQEQNKGKEQATEKSKDKGGESKDKTGSNKGAEKNEDDKKQALVESAKMTAVFKRENGTAVLKQVMPEEETFGLAWLDKRTKKGYVFVDSLSVEDATIYNIPLIINGKKIKKCVKAEGSKTSFIIDAKVKLNIEDRHALNKFGNLKNGVISESVKDALAKKASEVIAASIKSAYESARGERADVMLIEDMFFKCKHRAYKDLKSKGYDFLADTEFIVNCDVTLN